MDSAARTLSQNRMSSTPALREIPAVPRLACRALRALRVVLVSLVAMVLAADLYASIVSVGLTRLSGDRPAALVVSAMVTGASAALVWCRPFFEKGARARHLLLSGGAGGVWFMTFWPASAVLLTGGDASVVAAVRRVVSDQGLGVGALVCALGSPLASFGLAPLFAASSRFDDTTSIEELALVLRVGTLSLLTVGIASLGLTLWAGATVAGIASLVVGAGLLAWFLGVAGARSRWRRRLMEHRSVLVPLTETSTEHRCILDSRPTHAVVEPFTYRQSPRIHVLLRVDE